MIKMRAIDTKINIRLFSDQETSTGFVAYIQEPLVIKTVMRCANCVFENSKAFLGCKLSPLKCKLFKSVLISLSFGLGKGSMPTKKQIYQNKKRFFHICMIGGLLLRGKI